MNLPWDTQGIARGEFDLVYGVNVLHVAKDLLFSLGQARDALAPDGRLIISECVRPYLNQPMYPELVFQILDSFTDVDIDPEFARKSAPFASQRLKLGQRFPREGAEPRQRRKQLTNRGRAGG